MLIGAALALAGSDRLPVAVLGDGDFMMAASAFWTAAHYGVPFLAVVSNNQSFFNDEVHQERVAVARNRPVENKWIGQRIGDPDIDIAGIARAQGVWGIGPVATAGELIEAVRQGAAMAKQGKSVVIDAKVQPGYTPNMVAGLTRND
jgi:thiamine pyrophosphate-dependent acetolactate synthase large subunit-like protein